MKLVKSLRAIVSLYVLACLLGPGFADPTNEYQVKNYEHPRLGNSSIRYCAPNQYWDYEEGRCIIVPGGGTVISIDNTKTCYPETIRARPPRRNAYYVCRPTKTIYAECEHEPIYDARLKKCTSDTRESYDIQPDDDNSNGADASCDHVDLPPCKRSGRYPIPSEKCFYYTCKSNGYRLTKEIHMCQSKGFDPETGECTSEDVCNNNGVSKNEETNTTAEGLSEDLQSPMKDTTSPVKSDEEKEWGSTSGYSQAEMTTTKRDMTTDKVITDRGVTSAVDDSTETSVTYRSTSETTTEVSTIKLQPTPAEAESSTQDSVTTAEGQDGKESSSTLNNSNTETTTAQPDVSTISRKRLTTTVDDFTGTSVRDRTTSAATTELPKNKIQSTEGEVETSTDSSITTVKPEDGKESRSTSGYSQAEMTTVKPDTTTDKVITDKGVTSAVDDSTDTSVTYRNTSETTTEVSTIKLQPTLGETESSTQDSITTAEGQDGKDSSSTLKNSNTETTTAQPAVTHISRKDLTTTVDDSTGTSVRDTTTSATTTELPMNKIQSTEGEVETSTDSSITTVKLQEGKEPRSTLGYSQTEAKTVQPDTAIDKAVTSTVDDTTNTPAYTNPSIPSSETNDLNRKERSTTMQDALTSSTDPEEINHETTRVPAIGTSTLQPSTFRRGETTITTTFDNLYAATSTAQPDQSSNTDKTAISVDHSTEPSITYRSTSATTTEASTIQLQSTQGEIESSTDDSITTVKPQEGKEPRSTAGYSQAEATTLSPDTTVDKTVTSTVHDTTDTFGTDMSTSIPTSESKDFNRNERSTTMQDALTSSPDPDEINHETTRVPAIGTSTPQPSTLESSETMITTKLDNLYAATSTAQPDQSSNTDKTAVTSDDSTDSSVTYNSTSSTTSEVPKITSQSTQGEILSSTDDSITTVKPQEGKEPRSTAGYSQAEATTLSPDTTVDKTVTSTVHDTTDTFGTDMSTSIPTSESKDFNRKEKSTTMQDALTSSPDPDEINHETTRVPAIGTSTPQPSTLESSETMITTKLDNLYAATSTAQPDQSSNTDKTAITPDDSTDSSVTYKSTSSTTPELPKITSQSTQGEILSSTDDSITTAKPQEGKEPRSTAGYSQAEATTLSPDTTVDKTVTSTVHDTTDTFGTDMSTSIPTSESKDFNRKERSTTMQDALTSSPDPDEINHETTRVPAIGTSTPQPSTLESSETMITTKLDHLYAATSTAQPDESSNTDKTAVTSDDSTDSSVTYKSTSSTTPELPKITSQSTQGEILSSTDDSITTAKPQEGKEPRSTAGYSQAEATTLSPDTTVDKTVTSTVHDTTDTFGTDMSTSIPTSESKDFNRKERSTTMQDALTSSPDPDEINHETTRVPAIGTSTPQPSTLESSETMITTKLDHLYAATSTVQPDESSNTDKTAVTSDDSTDSSVTYNSTSSTTPELPKITSQSTQGEILSSTDDSITTVKPQEGKEPRSTAGYSQAEATTLSPDTTVDKTVTSTVHDTTDTFGTDMSTSIPTSESKDFNRKERSTTMQDALTSSPDPDEINHETTRVPAIGTSTPQPSTLEPGETMITTKLDNLYAATSTAQPDQSSNTDKTAITPDDSTDSSVTYKSTSSTTPELPKITSQSTQGEILSSTDDSITTVKPQEGKEPRSTAGYSQAEATTLSPDTTVDKTVTSTVHDTTDTFGTDMSTSIPTSESKDFNRKERSTTMQDALTSSPDPDEINHETTRVPAIGTSTPQPSTLEPGETMITTKLDNLYAATSTAQPDESSNTDKTAVTSDDSTDSSVTYKSTSSTTPELPKITSQSTQGEILSSTDDSITTVKPQEGKEPRSTAGYSQAEATTLSPDTATDKGLTSNVDETTDTFGTDMSTSIPTSESKDFNRKERSTTMQDALTSSPDPDEINHETTRVPAIGTSTPQPSTLESSETMITTKLDNLYAATSTAQPDQSSNTDKTAITPDDSTDSSVTYKSTSSTTPELPKITSQSTQGEILSSTDDSITTAKPQEGKEPRSTAGYSQAEATTLSPDTTVDKTVTSTVHDTTDTFGTDMSTSIPTSESKDFNRKERSTTMQDALTSSPDPDEINHETTRVPAIGTSTPQPSTLELSETMITTKLDHLYAATSTAQPDESSNTDKTAVTSDDSTDSSVTYNSTSSTTPELPKITSQSTQGEILSSTDDSITTVEPQEGKEPRSTAGYSQAEATTLSPDTTVDKTVTSTVHDTTDTFGTDMSTSIPTSESKDFNRKERSTTMQDALTSSPDPDEINHETTRVPAIGTSTPQPSTLESSETMITTKLDHLYAATSTAQPDESSNTDKTAVTSDDSTDSSVTYNSTSSTTPELPKITSQSTQGEILSSTDDSITTVEPQEGKEPRSTAGYSQAEATTLSPDTTVDKTVTSTVHDTTDTFGTDMSTSIPTSESKDFNRKERSTTMQDALTSSPDPDEINHETTRVPAIGTSTPQPSTLEPGETMITTKLDNLYGATSTAQPDQSSNTDKTAITPDDSTDSSVTYKSTSSTTPELPKITSQSTQGEILSSTDDSITTVKPQEGKEPRSTAGYSQAEATTLSPDTTVDKTVTSTVHDTTDTFGTDMSTSIPTSESKDFNRKERSTTMQDALTSSPDPGEINHETTRVPAIGTSTPQPSTLEPSETMITTKLDNLYAATSTAQPDQSSNTDKTAITPDDSTDSSVTYKSTSSTTPELPKITSQSTQGEILFSTNDSITTVKPQEGKEPRSTAGNSQAEATTLSPDTATDKGLTSNVDDTTDTFGTDMSASIPTSQSKDLNREKRSISMQDALTVSTDSDEINYETAITTTFDNLYAATSAAQPDRSRNADKTAIALDDSTDSSGNTLAYESVTPTYDTSEIEDGATTTPTIEDRWTRIFTASGFTRSEITDGT